MESIFNSCILGSKERKYLETKEISYMVIKEKRGGCFHRNHEKRDLSMFRLTCMTFRRESASFLAQFFLFLSLLKTLRIFGK